MASAGGSFAGGSGAIYGSAVVCTGEEEKLSDCTYDIDISTCGHANDAGVNCTVDCTYNTCMFFTLMGLLCIYINIMCISCL